MLIVKNFIDLLAHKLYNEYNIKSICVWENKKH